MLFTTIVSVDLATEIPAPLLPPTPTIDVVGGQCSDGRGGEAKLFCGRAESGRHLFLLETIQSVVSKLTSGHLAPFLLHAVQTVRPVRNTH